MPTPTTTKLTKRQKEALECIENNSSWLELSQKGISWATVDTLVGLGYVRWSSDGNRLIFISKPAEPKRSPKNPFKLSRKQLEALLQIVENDGELFREDIYANTLNSLLERGFITEEACHDREGEFFHLWSTESGRQALLQTDLAILTNKKPAKKKDVKWLEGLPDTDFVSRLRKLFG